VRHVPHIGLCYTPFELNALTLGRKEIVDEDSAFHPCASWPVPDCCLGWRSCARRIAELGFGVSVDAACGADIPDECRQCHGDTD
jgi:hypothetical protein